MSAKSSLYLPGTVLLTGASGFVGGRLKDALLDAGSDVIALVRKGSPVSKRGRSAAVDYADVPSLRSVIERERPSFVFHVAGATKGVRYEEFQAANVMPTRHLLQAISEVYPTLERVVHVSSLTAYGPSNAGPPKRETDLREPVEHYGRSKLEAEQVVESFGTRLPWTILRPACVYGPGDVDYLALFKAASKGVKLYYGNRDKRASMVYVDDVVRALVASATSAVTRGRGYFICDGQPRTWEQVTERIASHSGRRTFGLDLPGGLVRVAALAGEAITAVDKKPRLLNRQKATLDAQQAWECTHEAAARDFGYAPEVSLDEGVRRTFAWYREHGWV